MARKSTKEKILDAAEKLFAEKGYDGTSVRSICDAGGVNVAAVHYHFNGKEGVAEAIFEHRMAGLSARRKELLDELFAQNSVPTEHALIATMVVPLVELIDSEGTSGQAYVGMLAHFLHERSDILWSSVAKFNRENIDRQSEGMVKALPHIPEDVLGRRQTLAFSAAVHWLANPVYFTMEGPDNTQQPGTSDLLSELVDFLAGGLSAPVK